MHIGMDIQIDQSQKLIMTPQVEQSLKILRMDRDELESVIEEALLSNTTLEVSESYYRSTNYSKNEENEAYINSAVDESSLGNDLIKSLLVQLHTCRVPLSRKLIGIGEVIIQCIDSRGYLPYSNEEIAHMSSCELIDVEKMIDIIQNMEPKGIGGRNLIECLVLQTDREVTKRILKNELNNVARNNIKKISKNLDLNIQEVRRAINEIKSMEPLPSRGYRMGGDNNFIYPDIIITNDGDVVKIELTKTKSSYLSICQSFMNKEIFKNYHEFESEYIRQNLREGKMLIQAVKQREKTLKKVVLAIVDLQHEFFTKGKLYLSSINMRDLAEELEVHESTVSRAVNGKYLQCKWGIFELKYFFSNKIVNTKSISGSELNPKNVLKELIDDEDKSKPLSDDKLSKLMKEHGITISRRTVTKYREQMKIPSSGLRRLN